MDGGDGLLICVTILVMAMTLFLTYSQLTESLSVICSFSRFTQVATTSCYSISNEKVKR